VYFPKARAVLLSLVLLSCGGGGRSTRDPPDAGNVPPAPPPPSPPPEVVTPSCNNVIVRWELSLEREDRSELDGLSFGTLYVGLVPFAYGEWAVQYEVDAYVLQYPIPQDTLPGGVHWISMTVTDLDGLASVYSDEVKKECSK
jgi:hypothetical protein